MPAVATSVIILGLNLADWVAVLSIIVIVSGFLRLVWTRAIRPLARLLDDIQGEPARLGVKAQPGWAERLTNIEDALESVKAEVTHTGGSSMKDQTHRIEQAVEEVNLRSVDLTRKLNDHIADAVRRIHHLEVDVHRPPCDECGHLHHGDAPRRPDPPPSATRSWRAPRHALREAPMSEQQPVQPDHGVYDADAPADVQPDYTADHVTLEEEQ